MDERISKAKKAWVTPELTTLGTVERLTQQGKCKTTGTTDDFGIAGIDSATPC
jgi:hypothetical protein